MDKNQLNARLAEIIKQIKSNSKDSRFAEKLMEDFRSVHRKKCEVKLVCFDIGEELYRIEKNNYYVAKHERGVLFHIYNSFDLVVPVGNNSLYGTLAALLDEHKEKYNSFSEEEKLNYDTYLEVASIILALPLNAFSDIEFAINIATQIIKHTEEKYLEAISKAQQEETVDEDATFRDTSIASEDASNHIEEALKGAASLLKE